MQLGDALAISIGLDPAAFNKGSKDVSASLKKTRENAVKEGKEVERSLDSAGEAVERLARNALKLAAIFTGGRALGTFITDIGRADAAMGRMSDRLGVAPERVAAFDNAIKRMGGSAGEGAAAFQRMSDTVNELRSTGNSSALPALAKLQAMSGQQIRLNGETEESLGDLAEAAKRASERVGAARASFELRNAGYGDAAINQLLKGRAELQKALAQSQRSGLVSKADADAARALGAQYEDLSDKVADFGRRISTALTPILTDLMKRFGDWIDKNKEWLAQDVATEVGKFATELRKIPWDDVAKGIKEFVKGANDGAQAVGGWTRVAEIFFGLWIGSKVVGVLASIAAIRNALVIGDTSLLAAMARVGIPVAIGAFATGHGYQTAEDYKKSLQTDPDAKKFDDERIDQRGRVRDWFGRQYGKVQRFGRRLLGGGSAEAEEGRGGAGIRTRARRSVQADKTNYNFTGENADVLRQAAKELGTSPENLATVISYESKFRPNVWGGKGGNYMGLIQFGPSERAQFGANDKQSFKEQMPAVVRYLKTRGFKPGMGLVDLYSTINAGSPGHPNRSDGYGTVASHAAKMQVTEAARVRRFLNSPSAADVKTIQDTASGARRPDVLADPKDERRKPMASLFYGDTPPGVQAGARSAVAQQQSALADRAAVTQNDNRSTSTSTQEAHFHGDMVFNNAGDSREIAGNLRARLKEPQFVSAANTGQA